MYNLKNEFLITLKGYCTKHLCIQENWNILTLHALEYTLQLDYTKFLKYAILPFLQVRDT